MTRKIDPVDVSYSAEQLRIDYVDNGVAEHVLAHRHGVSRNVIQRWLREAGIPRRGASDAGRVRAAKMTAEERAAQAAAAQAAVRGRKATWYERCRSARSRELNPPLASTHEQAFEAELRALRVPYRREVAIGPYNVDFAVGPVAVEILGGEWHLDKTERHGERTPYILSEHWSLAFVWAVPNYPLAAAAAYKVVTLANTASWNPAAIGEYWVIRGDGQLIASGRCEDGQFPGIPPARSA